MDEKNRKAYKKETKDFLIDNIDQLNREVEEAYRRIHGLREQLREAQEVPPKRPWYGWKFGVLSLDFWPPRDWLRLSYRPWGPGKYAQLCVGPIRVDWADG